MKRVLTYIISAIAVLLVILSVDSHSHAATYAGDYNFLETIPSCTYTITCPGHGHSFEALSTCSGCGGAGKIYNSCSTCGGDGKLSTIAYKYCSKCNTQYSSSAAKCTTCKITLTAVYTSCSTCGGDGKLSTYYTCSRCNGYGKNTKCTRNGCLQGYDKSYDHWTSESGYNATCYKCSSHSVTASSHTLNKTAITNKNDGYYYYTCSVCKQTYLKYANPYTIMFDSNGGEGEMGAIATRYRNDVTLPTVLYAKEGHTFDGWLGSDGNIYTDKATVTQLTKEYYGVFTFSATWKANSYKLIFNASGGTVDEESRTVTFGEAYGELPIPTKTGYTFKGWYTLAEDGELVTADTIMQSVGDVTIYAVYEKNYYTLTFDVNDGDSVETVSVSYAYGERVSLDVKAFKADHLFVGWARTEDAAASKVLKSFRMPAHDVSLYAIFAIPYSDINRLEVHTWYWNNGANSYQSAWDKGTITKTVIPKSSLTVSGTSYYCNYKINSSSTVINDIKSGARNFLIKAYDNAGNESVLYIYKTTSTEVIPQYQVSLTISHITRELDGTHIFPAIAQTEYVSDVYLQSKPGSMTLEEVLEDEVATLYSEHGSPLAEEILQDGFHFSEQDVSPMLVGETVKKVVNADGELTTTTVYNYVASLYYDPDSITLNFDLNAPSDTITWNDGTQEIKTQLAVYDRPFGPLAEEYMPLNMTEEDEYSNTFEGWYTKPVGGERVTPSDICKYEEDTTFYGHWSKNEYMIVFHYTTNGGESLQIKLPSGRYSTINNPAGIYSTSYNYGSTVPLSNFVGIKTKWKATGWNTNPNATKGLDKLVVEKSIIKDGVIHVYAIYEHMFKVSFNYVDNDKVVSETVILRIYNNSNVHTYGSDDIPDPMPQIGWNTLGYSKSTKLNTSQLIDFTVDGRLEIENASNYAYGYTMKVYAVYDKDITLSYDTNGGIPVEIQEVTQKAYMHSYQKNTSYPTFTVTEIVPELNEHSFVCWIDKETGMEYKAGDEVELENDMTLTAKWDAYPEIEAYDRYFTLEDAQAGLITQEALLEKVVGSDLEDGVLINGTDVIVLDYNASEFTSFGTNGSMSVTYQATDSFGNRVTKMVMIHIVDTTASESDKVEYVRFITNEFYKDGDSFVEASEGGLEELSRWRNDETYTSVLDYAMSNQKSDIETADIEFMGTTHQVKKVATGSWSHVVSVWNLNRDDLDKMDEFMDSYGFGNIKVSNGIEVFYEWFERCNVK